MKIIKLRTAHYKDMEKLMYDCQVVDGNHADPGRVLVNPIDLKKMEKEAYNISKKESPWRSKKAHKTAVGYHMLNISPRECKAVVPGFALVLENEEWA